MGTVILLIIFQKEKGVVTMWLIDLSVLPPLTMSLNVVLYQLWLIAKVSDKWVTITCFYVTVWLIPCNCCQIQTQRSPLWNVTGHSYIANYMPKEQISPDNVTYWCSHLAHIINESQCCFLCQLWLIVKVSYKWVTIGYFDDTMWLITCNCYQIQTLMSQ